MNASDTQRILDAVGEGHEGIIADLDELLAGFADARRRDREHARFRHKSAPPRESQRAALRIASAARELEAALDAAPTMVRDLVMAHARTRIEETTVGDLDIFDGPLLDVARAVARAADLVAENVRVPAKTGPRVDNTRQALDVAVGRILKRHGIKATASTAGPLARLLPIVAKVATGERTPVDMRPRLRTVVRVLAKG